MVEHYWTSKTEASEVFDDFDELDKLGQGFTMGLAHCKS
jgi:hypothetical protein